MKQLNTQFSTKLPTISELLPIERRKALFDALLHGAPRRQTWITKTLNTWLTKLRTSRLNTEMVNVATANGASVRLS